MSPPGGHAISVVISTYQRPDACEGALRSVLSQTVAPLEVLVCDNGSRDDTEARMRAWESRDERVRYLRTQRNTGTPGSTRNLGIHHARGTWVAFLDDDDQWLPGKLQAQLAALSTAAADVIATNALRSDGSAYFPHAPPCWRPTRRDLLRANPIIVSSAIVARERLLASGGFQASPRVRGIEDYSMWLELTRRGARLAVLGEPLVRYEDAAEDRMSGAVIRTQVRVARLVWAHAARTPTQTAGLAAALRHTAGVAYLLARSAESHASRR